MVRIAILGTGNVATHLFSAFASVGDVEIVQVIGRNKMALESLVKDMERIGTASERIGKASERFGKTSLRFGKGVPLISSDFSEIADADIYLIAVSDDAITEVSEFLKDKKELVVHTSGSVSMEVLSQHPRHGVFYPLQTFSREREVDMRSVPFCLEAQKDADLNLLKKLAGQLSDKVYEVDSPQRESLHLAAVFVNNFTNHLYHIAQDICRKKGLPFEILHPLVWETVDKIATISPRVQAYEDRDARIVNEISNERKTVDIMQGLSPFEAQTGPARRGDTETIKNHLEQLIGSDYRKVYQVLSQSILNLYR